MIGPGLPGAVMEAFASNFDCGLVGTIGVTIDDGDGNNVLPRTTANIVQIECVASAAVYRYLGVYPSDASLSPYVITWDDTLTIAAEEILVSTDEPVVPSTTGPCGDWITGEDVVECCGDLVYDSDTAVALDLWASIAGKVLFLVSGEQFTGLCGPITVRPCRTGCGCWPFWQSIAYAQGGSRMVNTGWVWGGGIWTNPSGGRCGCGCTPRVLLSGYPVQGISQVKINGEVVPPSSYRLDEGRYLTRIDGDQWPYCQDLAAEDDQEGTFSVSYWYGQTPDALAQAAAAALACEMFNACDAGRECSLPTGAVRIIRQGVTIERLQPLAQMLLRGETGIPVLDAFLAAHGGYGRRRPSVWSPDGPRYARPVG